MPDRLEAVRDAVQDIVEPAAERAPFDELVERAARRRHRRWQVAAAAVLVLVGAGLLLSKPVGDQVATPPATSTRTPSAPLHGNEQLIQSMQFADPEHGYAVVIACRGPGYRCAARATTLRTTDGGRTWSVLRNPADTEPGEVVRVWEATEHGVVLCAGDLYYYSTDLVTWHERPINPQDEGGTVETVPADWRADVIHGAYVALDPITNRFRQLAHQPDLPRTQDHWTINAGPDQRLIAVASNDSGGLWLAYSEDRGRTWHGQPVPAHHGGDARMVLADDGTDRVYLVDGDPNGRLNAISRLDHLGGAWVSIPVPTRVTADPNPGTMKVVRLLPDGELLYDVDDPFRTEDGGTRVVPVPLVRIYGFQAKVSALQSIDGILFSNVPPGIDAPDGVVSILVSTDSGRTWSLRESRFSR